MRLLTLAITLTWAAFSAAANQDEESAFAEQRHITVTSNAGAFSSSPGDLVDVTTGDWNADGSAEFAVLSVSKVDELYSDLVIYERYGEAGARALLMVENFFFTWGHASLNQRSDTSFSVEFGNSNGRGHWRSEMTIAHRNGNYVVAGYTVEAYDSFAPENARSCDVNLLTGDYEVVRGFGTESAQTWNGRDEPASFLLADLESNLDSNGDFQPAPCDLS